ncbi:hypothetical protein [Gracilibacillus sp. YIM 98692]|uniref:hypothetical protein n=1 Tax=Gracilibacillus sp. YIM 98692 TaxID=2663532 RepID=UPI0013D25654|nr:hypothetical protein [Gracilibacillus sp. YIM 98692]
MNIRKALDNAGYFDAEATEENMIDCFLDYVDCDAFRGLSYEETKDDIEEGWITVDDIVYNMRRLR